MLFVCESVTTEHGNVLRDKTIVYIIRQHVHVVHSPNMTIDISTKL